jgi:hypothetical protein
MTRAPDLQWREIDDVLGVPGWALHVGYTYTQEIGDAPDVWIHAGQIETGHQTIHLARADLPNVHQLEAVIAEQVEDENRQAALELSQPDPRDDGDYSFDLANERRHERDFAAELERHAIGTMLHTMRALR